MLAAWHVKGRGAEQDTERTRPAPFGVDSRSALANFCPRDVCPHRPPGTAPRLARHSPASGTCSTTSRWRNRARSESRSPFRSNSVHGQTRTRPGLSVSIMRPPAQRSLLAGAAAVARNNLGAIIGCLVLFMIFGPSLRGAPSTASNYKAFTPRSLPPPGPREPSPFRAPLCAAPAWPGSALVEDMDHCPPPGTVYGNYQADELIKVRGGEGMERAAAARFRIPRPALPPPSILTFPPSFALSLSLSFSWTSTPTSRLRREAGPRPDPHPSRPPPRAPRPARPRPGAMCGPSALTTGSGAASASRRRRGTPRPAPPWLNSA